MKKISFKKKYQFAKTAEYRKKTHFSKKDSTPSRCQGINKSLQLKPITTTCYENVIRGLRSSSEGFPKRYAVLKKNTFFLTRRLLLKR
jgi:hypothetical protein